MTSLTVGVLFESLAVTGISHCQGVLFAAHLFFAHTWIAFFPFLAPVAAHALRISVLALSFSFLAASLLNFRHSNWFVSSFYMLASVWLGFANYFFLGACLLWPLWYLARALGAGDDPLVRPLLAGSFVAIGISATVYGSSTLAISANGA